MSHPIRSVSLLVVVGIGLLVGPPARAAQNYLMSGKFAISMGLHIDIPVIGDNPGGVRNCGLTTMSAVTMTGTMTGQMIPGMSPIVQGYQDTHDTTMVATVLPISMTMFANPRGCISVAGKLAATAPGTGKAFTLPTMAFNHMLPGMTVAVEIPEPTIALQLATSFAVTGPPAAIGMDPMTPLGPHGTMNNGKNTAKFRFFHKSAWKSQTGRLAATFTWCFGNPNCTKAEQAKGHPNTLVDQIHQLIVKYKNPRPNKFGGTISFIISSGPNPSQLAIHLGEVAQFLGLAGDGGHAETGRGYAEYGTAPLMGGKAFAMYKVGPVYVKQIMSFQNLITSLMTGLPGYPTTVTVTRNKNFGFPFTTGTVLVRNTGTDIQKNPAVITLTGMGGDVITPMGARNISLVAGAVAGIDQLSSETPNMSQLFLPEPEAPVALIAGVIALLAIAAWRLRKVH